MKQKSKFFLADAAAMDSNSIDYFKYEKEWVERYVGIAPQLLQKRQEPWSSMQQALKEDNKNYMWD